MRQYMKFSLLSLLCLIIISTANVNAQEVDSTSHHRMKNNSMTDSTHMKMMDSPTSHMKMEGHKMNKKKDMSKNPIIHDGEIDLKSIDKNKDGKVYQDMMDFNVISDKPGKCPLCGMTLKEVPIDKAKETLLKNDFKVKK